MGTTLEPVLGLLWYVSILLSTSLIGFMVVSRILRNILRLADPSYASILEQSVLVLFAIIYIGTDGAF